MKQNFKGVSKTLLIPLWGQVSETKQPHPTIKHEKAFGIMKI
jgi:O-methyltransferase involved in polyketide biosynthesis